MYLFGVARHSVHVGNITWASKDFICHKNLLLFSDECCARASISKSY